MTSWSIENPVVRNPAGYGTIPPSSYRSGLINTPNPIDPTGNLLMTGNVRRGMHFRGSVPYQSTTSFNATLGSSALNSFLRDSAGSEDFGSVADKYRVQPFYSPTQTVTTMMPGRSEVFSPMSMRIDDRVRQGTPFVGDGLLGLDSSPRGHTSLSQDATTGDSNFQELQNGYPSIPLRVSVDSAQNERISYRAESSHERSRDARQMEKSLDLSQGDGPRFREDGIVPATAGIVEPLVPGQLGIREAYTGSAEESALLVGDVSRDRSGKENLPAPPRRRPAKDDLTRYPDEEVRQQNLKSRREMLRPDGSVDAARRTVDDSSDPSQRERSVTGLSGLGAPDQATLPTPLEDPRPEFDGRREILEQIRQQLDALAESVEAGLEEDTGSIFDTRYSMLNKRESGIKNPDLLNSRLDPDATNRTAVPFKSSESVAEVGFLSMVSSLDELKEHGKPGISDTVVRTKGSYESLESFSQSRFNQHLSAARDHLKAGQYYRAVDSFTLASVYQPNSPVVLAGKGHALFAAGEYMSSALFLARALTVQPDYPKAKVDLAAMLGSVEKLTERIAEVEQWLARSGSTQLQFLLSYVYYHTGRLNQAKQAIGAAYEKMPQSPAVVALRTAINQATK